MLTALALTAFRHNEVGAMMRISDSFCDKDYKLITVGRTAVTAARVS